MGGRSGWWICMCEYEWVKKGVMDLYVWLGRRSGWWICMYELIVYMNEWKKTGNGFVCVNGWKKRVMDLCVWMGGRIYGCFNGQWVDGVSYLDCRRCV
jgi:hypothetical protein